jgi:hypothetical protein
LLAVVVLIVVCIICRNDVKEAITNPNQVLAKFKNKIGIKKAATLKQVDMIDDINTTKQGDLVIQDFMSSNQKEL